MGNKKNMPSVIPTDTDRPVTIPGDSIMRIESRSIDSIHPYEKNPRKNAAAIDVVVGYLKQFGFRQPIVVDKDGVIIVGHTRFAAAKKLGMVSVPVHVAADMSETDAQAYRLTDNQAAEFAQWDFGLLKDELFDLKEQDFDIEMLAFDESLIEQLEPVQKQQIDNREFKYGIMIECKDEAEQAKALEHTENGGFKCRTLIL